MTIVYYPRLPEVIADPYPTFHRLQAEDPVHWSEPLGGWVLTRYADVRAALNEPRLSSDRITPF
jgi:cytochrome P450